MRKVIFYGAVSLDGYLADKNDNLQWLFDTELGGTSTYDTFAKNIDTLVMGRVTYEETKKLLGAAPFYPGKEKIVFSRKITGTFPEGRFVSERPEKVLHLLKEQTGKAIWIVGGGSLLTTLIEADLVDEFYIQIAPVLLGEGKRLFPEGNYRQRLTFVGTTQMGELIELHYQKQERN